LSEPDDMKLSPLRESAQYIIYVFISVTASVEPPLLNANACLKIGRVAVIINCLTIKTIT